MLQSITQAKPSRRDRVGGPGLYDWNLGVFRYGAWAGQGVELGARLFTRFSRGAAGVGLPVAETEKVSRPWGRQHMDWLASFHDEFDSSLC